MVWTIAAKRVDVCRNLLDVGGMGTSHMGLSGWPIGCFASEPFSYRINTYHAWAIAALGEALVLDALSRQMKTARSGTVGC
jgi:hypothetical protein